MLNSSKYYLINKHFGYPKQHCVVLSCLLPSSVNNIRAGHYFLLFVLTRQYQQVIFSVMYHEATPECCNLFCIIYFSRHNNKNYVPPQPWSAFTFCMRLDAVRAHAQWTYACLSGVSDFQPNHHCNSCTVPTYMRFQLNSCQLFLLRFAYIGTEKARIFKRYD